MTIIEFDQIRVGDTVQRDLRGITSAMTVAKRDERRVCPNDLTHLVNYVGSTWTLIDRPKPAVELPTVPTLGWASGPTFDPLLAVWSRVGTVIYTPAHRVDEEGVTAFTPATAVPTEALVELRDHLTRTAPYGSSAANWKHLGELCRDFLAAVDAANGPRA